MTSLSERDRADYGFARVRDAAFDAVHTLLSKRKEQGMKQSAIAGILKRDPAWVSRSLKGPANWTLRTLGELVEALDGEVEIIVHDLHVKIEQAANHDAYHEYKELAGSPINLSYVPSTIKPFNVAKSTVVIVP